MLQKALQIGKIAIFELDSTHNSDDGSAPDVVESTAMKPILCAFGFLMMSALASAQTPLPVNDASLVNLQTPVLLAPSKSAASVDLRYIGGYDKDLRGNLWVGYGVAKNFEIDLAGSFEQWKTVNFENGGFIRFGGTDEELSLRYQTPLPGLTVQGGADYVQTPAQGHHLATSLGASYGYALIAKLRLYANPRAEFLDNNSLFGLGLGAVYEFCPKLSLMADWTPILAGDNDISTASLSRSRVQLYSVGVRLSGLVQNGSLDFGVTNSNGITTGSSLTPTLGDSPALFARFTYRF